MKKDLIFAPILIVVGALLALLKVTGLPVHVVLSVVGAIVLVVYTVLTKKNWKIPALEIGMRASYGLALISGVVIKIKYVLIVSVLHKLFAILFLITLIVIFAIKLNKKNNK